MRDVSRPGYNPNERPPTPEDMKLGPAPSRTNVSPIYPLAYRRILEVSINSIYYYFYFNYFLSLIVVGNYYATSIYLCWSIN